MHVVVDGRYPQDRYPGIGRYVETLVGALAALANGPDLTLVCHPSHAFGASPSPTVRPLRRLETTAAARSLAEQVRLPTAVRRADADLWHAPYLVYPYALPVPVVVTVHDVIGMRFGSPANRRAVALAMRLAIFRARLVLTSSEAAARDISRAFPRCAPKLRVVPIGVARRFSPPPTAAARQEGRTRLGLPTRYLLFVGTDRPHKNLARLVEGFGRYRRMTGDDVPLVVAGPPGGRSRGGGRRAVAALGLSRVVRFLGRVPDDDLPALYAGAELFLAPSLEEGFGLPVLEAMACGAAVACSTAPALVELAGDAAVVFSPHDAGAMAEAIAQGLDRREELGGRALARAARYSAEVAAARTTEVYREARDGPPSPWRYHP